MGFFIKIYDQLHIDFFKLKVLLKDVHGFLFIRVYFGVLFIFDLLLWYLAFFMYRQSNQDIAILHYNVDFGIDLIGSKSSFFIIPTLSLVFIIVNQIILLLLVKKKDFKFWSYFLLSFLLLFHCFLLMSVISTYLINF